jgi:hypothetical protein
MRFLSVACAIALPGALVAQVPAAIPQNSFWSLAVSTLHARDSHYAVFGAGIALGAVMGHWEIRGTVARYAARSPGACQDDCPADLRSTADAGLLYHRGTRRRSTYVGAGFGWASSLPALHVAAGLDRAVRRLGVVRLELRATQGLQGYTDSSLYGGTIDWPPLQHVAASIGFGLQGPF